MLLVYSVIFSSEHFLPVSPPPTLPNSDHVLRYFFSSSDVSVAVVITSSTTRFVAGALYTRLQLSIACKGLANLDKLSKSDPFVVSDTSLRTRIH